MIARISVLLIALILIPDAYLYVHYIYRRPVRHKMCHILWWIPSLVILIYTLWMSSIKDFAPSDISLSNIYLFLIGIIVLPKLFLALFSAIGLLVCRVSHKRRNYGTYVGAVLAVSVIYIMAYGVLIGNNRLVVKRVEMRFDSLPAAFDGYKIVHFSDLHIGSMDAARLERIVKTINSLSADAVLFTGDIQNLRPDELDGKEALLRSLRARDGVYSVLGNHDYATYIYAGEREKRLQEQEVVRREQSYGWRLLLNERAAVRRGCDSIIIAGEENDGEPPFPQKGDIAKTLKGLPRSSFVVLMQHDPSAWRRDILPHSGVQLTLSGHTHGGQISLFGFRPTSINGREDAGEYSQDGRTLYVSTGVGGFLPFRFNVPPEIVVITLNSAKK